MKKSSQTKLKITELKQIKMALLLRPKRDVDNSTFNAENYHEKNMKVPTEF